MKNINERLLFWVCMSGIFCVLNIMIYAGNYGWNTDPADDPRIQAAYGSILNLQRPATQREVSAAAMNWVASSTTDYEKRMNMQGYSPTPFATSPTPVPSPTPSPTATITPTPTASPTVGVTKTKK